MFNWFKKQENRYHKYLDIPVDPGIDLFSRTDYDPLYHCHIKIDREELNPELIEWFDQFDVQLVWFEAFYTPPYGGKIPIHTDTSTFCDVVKVNWTFGAPGTKLIWWNIKDEKNLINYETEFGTKCFMAEEKHCKHMYEVEVNKPSLVNVGRLHSTWNPTEQGRWTLSLPIIEKYSPDRVVWDDAVRKFDGYFIK